MKKIIVLVLAVAVVFVIGNKFGHRVNRNTPVLSSSGGGVEQREFVDLFESGAPFSSLAVNGKYTVVEVYLDTCGYCREFEAGFDKFHSKRQDVAMVRVHHAGQMQLKISGNTNEERQKTVQALNDKMKSYGLCGTPHVEVYGPDKQPLARDSCGKRAGTLFAWDWITAETGIKPREPVNSGTLF